MTGIDSLPRAPEFDNTLAVLREGYNVIPNRCDALNSDAFRTRVMLTPVVCMRGAEAAEAFYAGGRFSRERAMPSTVLKLVQDYGSALLLEGEGHHHRKRMFLSLLDAEGVQRLVAQFAQEWRVRLPKWEQTRNVVLFDEMREILFRAVCAWAGVPLSTKREIALRRNEITAMIDSTGRFGPRNWHALWLRRRSEEWAKKIVSAARAGTLGANDGAAVQIIAKHRDLSGGLLPLETAAVELLNIIRPTVAVAHYVVFAALALHWHPEWRAVFSSGDESDLRHFVLEVRRISPFFPFVGGRVRKPFRWRDIDFPEGQWVLLDLYGTCRHPREWIEPQRFLPERFRAVDHGHKFIPQGGGSYETDHRCPGEPATIALMMEATRFLTREMAYEVPEQNLTVDLARIPAVPRSGFTLARVRATCR